MTSVVVFGGSGFVGSAVVAALRADKDVVTRVVSTPRLRSTGRSAAQIATEVTDSAALVTTIAMQIDGADVVINAAGDPDASSLDSDNLFGANALWPAILLAACEVAGVGRLVHVSSAVVQNDRPVLDSSEDIAGFSPYSSSKVLGEEVLRSAAGSTSVTRYRPPSVHASGRRVTQMISRLAGTPVASVARPGTQPSPQAQLPNVASAIAFLATAPSTPPVVHHPSEGVTVSQLMRDLGGREPLRIPRWAAVFAVFCARLLGRLHRPTAANARRMEVLWLGQAQAESWLTEAGWTPPIGIEGWRALGRAAA